MPSQSNKSGSGKGRAPARQASISDIPDAFRDLLREERRIEIKARHQASSSIAASAAPATTSTASRNSPVRNTAGPTVSNDRRISQQLRTASVDRPDPDSNMIVADISRGRGRHRPVITSNITRTGSPTSNRAVRPNDTLEHVMQNGRGSNPIFGPLAHRSVAGDRRFSEYKHIPSPPKPKPRPQSHSVSTPGPTYRQNEEQWGGNRAPISTPAEDVTLKRRRPTLTPNHQVPTQTPHRDIELVREGKKRKLEVDSSESSVVSSRDTSVTRSRSISPSKSQPSKLRKNQLFESQSTEGYGDPDNNSDDDDDNDDDDGDDGDNISESDYSDDDSDIDWEDAALATVGPVYPDLEEPIYNDIEITFNAERTEAIMYPELYRQKKRQRRSAAATKQSRILLHKAHLLSLIWHGRIRNDWCTTVDLQVRLRTFITSKIRKCFRAKSDWSKPQTNHIFFNGLTFAMQMWSEKFRITKPGLRAAKHSPLSEEGDSRPKLDLGAATHRSLFEHRMEFLRAGDHISGSPDVGAQLLCALFRSIGLECRLVFSIQVLPLSGPRPVAKSSNNPNPQSHPNRTTSKRPTVQRVYLDEHGNIIADPLDDPYASTRSRDRRPVFWVEVFNPTSMKWIPVDAMATLSVNRPNLLEPPIALSRINVMTYVLAYEADGTIVDVTHRYTKSFHARTRRLRVDSIETEKQWYIDTIKAFAAHPPAECDRLEEAELKAKEMSEGIPRNIQGFRGHPFYALRRHLHHNQVIHKGREVGRVSIGSNLSNKWEPVYDRKDVHIVRSADRWYRQGLDIKHNEHPLKLIRRKVRRRILKGRPQDRDEDGHPPDQGLGEDVFEDVELFAEFQTEIYIPPPVVDGQVPKNVFGNIDVYVPSMVPAGATHITHPLAFRAAKLLGIDFADVIAGFNFSSGAGGAAIKNGIIVASKFAEGVHAVVESYELEEELDRQRLRREELLRMWHDVLHEIDIQQRVNQYRSIQGQKEDDLDWRENWEPQIRQEINEANRIREAESDAWWEARLESRRQARLEATMAEKLEEEERRAGQQSRRRHRHQLEKLQLEMAKIAKGGGEGPRDDDDGDVGGGFICEYTGDGDAGRELGGGGGFLPADGGGFLPGDGGGFLPEDGGGFLPEDGGGFLPEDADTGFDDGGGGGGFVPEGWTTDGGGGGGVGGFISDDEDTQAIQVPEGADLAEVQSEIPSDHTPTPTPTSVSQDNSVTDTTTTFVVQPSLPTGSVISLIAPTMPTPSHLSSSSRLSSLSPSSHKDTNDESDPSRPDPSRPDCSVHSEDTTHHHYPFSHVSNTESPGSDHGSLLSHDPDDDDGIPIWLMSEPDMSSDNEYE